MTSTCVQPVHLTLEFLPFIGRKSLNTMHTCRAALSNRGRLLCCRDSGLSACSLTGGEMNSERCDVRALAAQAINRIVTRIQIPVSSHHPSENKPQLQSGLKFGVPSLRVAGYNTLETSLVRSGANRGASVSAGQSAALMWCRELITGLYASLDIFSLLRPFSERTGILMFRGWRGFLILFSLLVTS